MGHSNPAAWPATLAHLPLQLGSCLQDNGARGSRVHLQARHPRHPCGPPPAPANWAWLQRPLWGTKWHSPPGRTQPRHVWGSTCAFGAGGSLHVPSCWLVHGLQPWPRPPGWCPGTPQALGAVGSNLLSPPSPLPPVLATGPRSGPSGNIWARPGPLWMDGAVVC